MPFGEANCGTEVDTQNRWRFAGVRCRGDCGDDEEYTGVALDKRISRADWLARPLSERPV